jgi:hypothetical protein
MKHCPTACVIVIRDGELATHRRVTGDSYVVEADPSAEHCFELERVADACFTTRHTSTAPHADQHEPATDGGVDCVDGALYAAVAEDEIVKHRRDIDVTGNPLFEWPFSRMRCPPIKQPFELVVREES